MFEADKACGVVESAFFLVAPPRGGLSVAPRDSDRCWKQFMMFFGGDSVCGDDSRFSRGLLSQSEHDSAHNLPVSGVSR